MTPHWFHNFLIRKFVDIPETISEKVAKRTRTGQSTYLHSQLGMDTVGSLYAILFSGGIVLIIANYLRLLLGYVISLLIQQICVCVEVTSQDEAFRWLMQWITDKDPVITASEWSAVVKQPTSAFSYWRRQHSEDIVSKEPPKLVWQLGKGNHILSYQGKLVWANRTQTNTHMDQTNQFKPTEVMQLWTWGRSKKALQKLLEEAMQHCLKQDMGKTVIYTIDNYGGTGWQRSVSKPARSIESVILDEDHSEELLNDAREFFASKEWYEKLGIPYRRTWLFYGKPGCGKTSFVSALAGKLNLNVCILNLNTQGFTDATLNMYLREAPMNSIILLEDVDAAFPARKRKQEKNMFGFSNGQAVTFSGLLNSIDGIAAQEGKLFIMTTNYLEKLDPALIRPGRVDKRVHFPLASKGQIIRMFTRFYPGETELAKEFADKIGDYQVSMSHLQGHFMGSKDDAVAAVATIDRLLQQVAEEKEMEQKRKQEEEREEQEEKEMEAEAKTTAKFLKHMQMLNGPSKGVSDGSTLPKEEVVTEVSTAKESTSPEVKDELC